MYSQVKGEKQAGVICLDARASGVAAARPDARVQVGAVCGGSKGLLAQEAAASRLPDALRGPGTEAS